MTHTKKILIITPYYPPNVGGVEKYVYNIARQLHGSFNWRVVIITSGSQRNGLITEHSNGIKIYRLPVWGKLSNIPLHPLWPSYLKRIFHAEKPNIVNAHAPVPFMADIAAQIIGNIPFVLTYHCDTMKKHIWLPDIAIALYEKFVLPQTAKKAKHIICSSEYIKNTLLKKYTNKITVIHPAVDTSVFKPHNGHIKKNNTVLFVCAHANMHTLKGLPILITAMNTIPNTRLCVVGERGQKHDKVEYLGIKSSKDLALQMQKSSVVVVPSYPYVESFGMTLIEAMACKTPVIGSRIGGIPEVISDGIDGLIIPPNNPEKLKEAIIRVLTDTKQANRMGEAGYIKVRKHFTWASQAQRMNRVLTNHIHTNI